jgi:DNA-binding HxlR family transcriptional regulator
MDVKRERYKRIRGAILKLLAHEHPGPIDFAVLHRLLDDLRFTMTEEELTSHLVYLEEKGCVKIDKRATSGVEIVMATITADGLDVLDSFRPDCGIDVRF